MSLAKAGQDRVQEKAAEAVLSLKNLIVIVEQGVPDKVVRIIPLKGEKLWLNNGPDIERWEEIKRQVFLKAPPDQKIATPVSVGDRSSWTLLPENVPIIDLTELEPTGGVEDDAEPVLKRGPGRPKKIKEGRIVNVTA